MKRFLFALIPLALGVVAGTAVGGSHARSRSLDPSQGPAEAQIQQLQQANNQALTDVQRLQAELRRIQSETSPGDLPANLQKAKPADLIRELKRKNAEADSLQRRLKEAEQERQKAEQKAGTFQADLKAREEKLKLLSKLSAESEKTLARLSETESRLQRSEEEEKRLRQGLEQGERSLREANEKAAQERRQMEQKLSDLKKELARAEQAGKKWEQEARAGRQDEAEVKKLRRELADANNRIGELVVSVDQYERLVAILRDSEKETAPSPEPTAVEP